MNKFTLIFFLLSLFISNTAISQNSSNDSSSKEKQRHVAAKLLIELDKNKRNNNNNNGRSNKSNCCNSGIAAPGDYQVLAFGLNTSWYLRGETEGQVGIPNPIPYLQSIESNWEVDLFSHNAEYIMTKAGYIQNNEALISIDDLPAGQYFIQIAHNEDYYATGFSIGKGKLPVSPNQQNKN